MLCLITFSSVSITIKCFPPNFLQLLESWENTSHLPKPIKNTLT